jgi:hypothetical protein
LAVLPELTQPEQAPTTLLSALVGRVDGVLLLPRRLLLPPGQGKTDGALGEGTTTSGVETAMSRARGVAVAEEKIARQGGDEVGVGVGREDIRRGRGVAGGRETMMERGGEVQVRGGTEKGMIGGQGGTGREVGVERGVGEETTRGIDTEIEIAMRRNGRGDGSVERRISSPLIRAGHMHISTYHLLIPLLRTFLI